jgi:hypothetical protein
MTLTTLHLGHVSGRARRVSVRPGHSVAAAAWRSATPAVGGLRATSVAPASTVGGNGYEGIAAPVGDLGFCTTPMTKRPARHLGSRST